MHKRVFLTVLFWLIASNAYSQTKATAILVFAGTGMRKPLMEIGQQFKRNTGIRIVYDFAGSGRLGNKILLGQKPALFIPGSTKWAKILKSKGYIKNYSAIAYHTPMIITPHGNHKVTSLRDFLKKTNRLVVGDPKAAAIGGISEKIFERAGINPSMMNIKARSVSVKQLVLWIEGNNADAAIVWRADAVQSGNVRVVDLADNEQVVDIIPLCVLKMPNEAATQYANYVLSAEGKKQFTIHGFKVVD